MEAREKLTKASSPERLKPKKGGGKRTHTRFLTRKREKKKNKKKRFLQRVALARLFISPVDRILGGEGGRGSPSKQAKRAGEDHGLRVKSHLKD